MRRFALVASIALCLAPLARAQLGAERDHEVVHVTKPEVADAGPRADPKAVAAAIVERTNAFRQAQGREPVAVNPSLDKAATAFARLMAESDEYGHTAGGKQPWERAEAAGYDYCIVLENIAHAFDSRGFADGKLAAHFVAGWEESPGHRRNMLDADVIETGVGVARSAATGHYYAVQVFGRPKSAAVEFTVANETGDEVKYAVGGKDYALPARATRRHTRCRPGRLTVALPGGESAVTPTGGERYAVVTEGGAAKLKRQ